MSKVTHYGHGVWCEICQEVQSGTDECRHGLAPKDGIMKDGDEYITNPADMGHYSPHMFIEVGGMQQCAECGATKIPAEMMDDE